jgi:hypothetical protein
MARCLDAIDHRATQIGPTLGQETDPVGDRLLLVGREAAPPVIDLVGDLNLPHRPIMSQCS